jgi:predicted nucleotidyltransferase
VDLLLHPAESDDRPDPRGRLSTVGHGEAFRAFGRAANKAGIRFMVIGGAYRDVKVRAASTRDIDIVLLDRPDLDEQMMRRAGFHRAPRSRHAWRYTARGDRKVELQIAAVASSSEAAGPFSVAFREAQRATIEGVEAMVPTVEDYVILKLLAALDDPRRMNRDLADVQHVFAAFADRARTTLSVPAIRARLRDLYGIKGERLSDLAALLRRVPRPSS